MARLVKIGLCLTMLCVLLAACEDEQDSIGWEPEVAAPLVLLSIDFNQKINLANYAKLHFGQVPTQAQQNNIVYAAITESLVDSVKKRLPPYLQVNVDTFIYRKEHAFSIPEFMAEVLLMDLYDNFEKNNSITAINNFTYHVLTNLPSNQQAAVKDSLYHLSIGMYEHIGLDMSTLNEKADALRWLKLQLFVSTRLKINAQMQVYLHDSNGYAFDSLFRMQNGVHEGQMPFATNVAGEYKQHIVCDYSTHAEAQKTIRMNSISLAIKSDSLCLDTSLLWLKDLHNRKINTSVGIMFKANLDDMIEK